MHFSWKYSIFTRPSTTDPSALYLYIVKIGNFPEILMSSLMGPKVGEIWANWHKWASPPPSPPSPAIIMVCALVKSQGPYGCKSCSFCPYFPYCQNILRESIPTLLLILSHNKIQIFAVPLVSYLTHIMCLELVPSRASSAQRAGKLPDQSYPSLDHVVTPYITS